MLTQVAKVIQRVEDELKEACERAEITGLYGVEVSFSSDFTRDGEDRPVTAIFDFGDSFGMTAEAVRIALADVLRANGVQQVVVNRLHWDDRDDVAAEAAK